MKFRRQTEKRTVTLCSSFKLTNDNLIFKECNVSLPILAAVRYLFGHYQKLLAKGILINIKHCNWVMYV